MLAVDWRNPSDSLDVDGDGFIAPVDTLIVINRVNSIGSGPLPDRHVPTEPFFDVSGDQFVDPLDALIIINHLNRDGAGLRTLKEGTTWSRETDVTITVGQDIGTRRVRFGLDFQLDSTDASPVLEDLLAVYVVSPTAPNITLLDRGVGGTAVFTLAGSDVELVPGLVRWDGEVLEIETTSLASLDTAVVRFQLLNSDADKGTRVTIQPLANTVESAGLASPGFPTLAVPVSKGPSLDPTGLAPAVDLSMHLENVRFDEQSGRFASELRVENHGDDVGRDVIVAFPDLPAGVSLVDASGTTAAGVPYVNLNPGIPRGGLVKGTSSHPVLVEFENLDRSQVELQAISLASLNRAPTLATISPQEVSPGQILRMKLDADDADGDALTFSVHGTTRLPNIEITDAGVLVVRPGPEDIGSYAFDIVVSDGAREVSRTVTLEVVADAVTNTRVSGIVLDTAGAPIEGLPIELGSASVLTDSDGRFEIDLGHGPVISDTLKVRGELFPGDRAYPFIAEKLTLLLGHAIYPSVSNTIERPIFLPELDLASGQTIDPGANMVITTEQVPGVALHIAAGTLFNQLGVPFTGVLSITEVPPELTPAALPQELFPELVVTIQPGEMSFAQPAPLSFPNRSELPPGTLLDLWSINPTTGDFDDVGDAQVSVDGLSIDTISGGVRNSSWHFTTPQRQVTNTPQNPASNNKNQEKGCPCEEELKAIMARSTVEVHGGYLHEVHELVSYRSLETSRGWFLRYDSEWADPRPIIHFAVDDAAGTSDDRLIARMAFERGGVRHQVPGFVVPAGLDSQFGLTGGEHFWSLPAGVNRIDAALQADLSSFPTGLYQFDVAFGVRRLANDRYVGTESRFQKAEIVVNERASAFGAGWTFAGLQKLIPNEDGSLLLLDGDGTDLLFGPATGAGQPFVSPPGDSSVVEQLVDGSFRRTLKDRTTYEFSVEGRLTRVVDRNGNATSYAYDAAGRLVSITDPVGLVTALVYANGKLATITDPAGRVTRFRHDDQGNLVEIIDPDSTSRQFSYDGEHRMIAEIDKRGNLEREVYGFHGRITEVIREDGTFQQFAAAQTLGLLPPSRTVDRINSPVALITANDATAIHADPRGDVVFEQLDHLGLPAGGSRDEVGALPSVLRNDQELPIQITDARGHVTVMTYDERHNLLTTVDSLGLASETPAALFANPVLPFGATNDESRAVALGDLNGDGHADLAIAANDTNAILVRLNDGSGGFGPTTTIAAGTNPFAVKLVDVNADQILDLTWVSRSTNSARRRLGNGDGSFGTEASVAVATSPEDLAFGDLDGDGDPDMVVAGSVNALTVMFNNGAGSFANRQDLAAGNMTGVVVADFNGDGHSDVAATQRSGGDGSRLVLLRGLGDGTFEAPETLASGEVFQHLAAADLNGDGASDLIGVFDGRTSPNFVAGGLAVLLNDGQGVFTASIRRETINNFAHLAIADLDSDGALDVVVTAELTDKLFTFRNDGEGAFGPRIEYAAGRRPVGVAVADLDADGDLEAVVANSASNDVAILEGRRDGTFFGREMTAGVDPNAILLADLDSDGDLDAGVLNGGAPSISILINPGDGSLTNRVDFDLPVLLMTDFAFGDLNGDGHPDIVATGSRSLNNGLFVLLGLGDGRFGTPTEISIPRHLSVRLADINGDHHLDAVIYHQQGASILPGLGNGTFAAIQEVPFTGSGSAGESAFALADLDQDGDLDLVAPGNNGRVALLLNDGLGGFAAPLLFAVDGNAEWLTVGDVDHDGHLDVVAADARFGSAAQARVSVLRSLGNNTFAPFVAFDVGRRPRGIALDDVDLDGNLDVIVACENSSSFTLLPGLGNGSFAPRLDFVTVSGPIGLAVGDLDLDGDPEVLTSSIEADVIGISTNHTLHANGAGAGDGRRSMTYDPVFNQVTSTTDELGRQKLFEIDPVNGNVLSVTQVVGAPGGSDDLVTQFSYSARGQLETLRDPLGRLNRFDYDPAGRLAETTFAAGTTEEASVRFEYDAAGNMVALVDELQRRTEYTYDALNRLTSRRDPLGGTRHFTYDATGNLTGEQDENGRLFSLAYDPLDRLLSQTDPLGGVQHFAYDRADNLVRQTDELGRTTLREYDARGRLIGEVDPAGGRRIFAYDADNNLIRITDQEGRTTRFSYDARNRLVQQTDSLGATQRFVYDLVNNLVQQSDELGRPTRYIHDDIDRLVRITSPDPDGGGSQTAPVEHYEYDSAGQLIRYIDPLGNAIDYEYDSRDRRIGERHSDPDGAGPKPHPEWQYEYDDRSRLVRVTDPLGREASLEYDSLDRVTRRFWPDPDQAGPQISPTESLAYDAVGNLVSRTDPLGNQTTHAYDALNRLVQTTTADPDGTGPTASLVTQWTYDASGQLLSVTDPLGRVTTTAYDVLRRPIEVAAPDPDGEGSDLAPIRRYEYDRVGNLTSSIDALGRVTRFEYDKLNRQIRRTLPDPDADGPLSPPVFAFAFDAAGQLLVESDPLGRLTQSTFDALGRLIALQLPDPDGNGPTISPIYEFEYDALGNTLSQRDPLGNITHFEYDHLNRLIARTDQDPDGVGPLAAPVTRWDYDSADQLTTIIDPLNRISELSYDDLGRLTRQTLPDPDGAGPQTNPEETYSYDLVGNLVRSADAIGSATSYEYDNVYRQVAIVDPRGDRTQLKYDAVGNLVEVRDPLGNTTVWQFDALDRPVRETNALGDARTFLYDLEDNLLEVTDRLGRVLRYEYDGLDRMVTERWLTNDAVVNVITTTYDAANQLLSIGDSAASYSYHYDQLGRVDNLVQAIDGLQPLVSLAMNYDSVGNRLRTSVAIDDQPDFVNEYDFDRLDRLVQIRQFGVAGGNAVADMRVDLAYDVASQRIALNRFHDLQGQHDVATTTYGYDAAGRLVNMRHGQGTFDLATYAWEYDAAQRIVSQISTLDGQTAYTYDASHQLSSASHDQLADESYTYDANGNRANGGFATSTDNRLVNDGEFSYSYDAEGNLMRRTRIATGEVTDYEWDHRNRLVRVVERAAADQTARQVVEHRYDPWNRWIARREDADGDGPADVNETYYVYDGRQIVLEFAGAVAETLAHRYLWEPNVDRLLGAENIASLTAPGERVWPLTDHLGTVRDIATYDEDLNATQIANHRVFAAFGQLAEETNAAVDLLFGFTGRPFDELTDLQNNENRWYDPRIGRWLTADPIGFRAGDTNLYRYVGNSPVDSVDPDGLKRHRSQGKGQLNAVPQPTPSQRNGKMTVGPLGMRFFPTSRNDGVADFTLGAVKSLGNGVEKVGAKVLAGLSDAIDTAGFALTNPNAAGEAFVRGMDKGYENIVNAERDTRQFFHSLPGKAMDLASFGSRRQQREVDEIEIVVRGLSATAQRFLAGFQRLLEMGCYDQAGQLLASPIADNLGEIMLAIAVKRASGSVLAKLRNAAKRIDTPAAPTVIPKRQLTSADVSPGMEIDPTEVNIFRGGSSVKPTPKDFKIDKSTGLVKTTHGVSLDVNAEVVNKFAGGAHRIESIPDELKIVQRSKDLGHFEIVPRNPVTPESFQNLLDQVVLSPVN